MVRKSSILFVEDEPTLRELLIKLANEQPEFEVVGEAGDGLLGLELYKKLLPDIVVTNIGMPLMNGLDLTKNIMEVNPEARVMMLTAHGSRESIEKGLAAGASIYVTKPVSTKEYLESLRSLID